MDGAKGEDYFEWDYKIEFRRDIDRSVLRLIEDHQDSITEESGNTVYFVSTDKE